MPEDKKSNRKNDPKEQRRSRRRHDQAVEKKENKQPVPVPKEPEPVKVSVPEKPAYEPPGPEFYKNLKRETDEILKITEEANTKYKKKEIQSNWAKYEMPIETYNEIEEQESMGADYEALIQAPLSVGGHFQFKHEKSWDISTGPSLYDKYFEIDMDNLALALSTIPFYEIDQSIFSEEDILSMNNRAMKFKQKYYNDKSYTTSELEAQEKILQKLRESDENESSMVPEEKVDVATKNIDFTDHLANNSEIDDEKVNTAVADIPSPVKCNNLIKTENEPTVNTKEIKEIESEKLSAKIEENIATTLDQKPIDKKHADNIDDIIDIVENKKEESPVISEPKPLVDMVPPASNIVKDVSPLKEKPPPKNPVIESPEDLEKWLDDFLDG